MIKIQLIDKILVIGYDIYDTQEQVEPGEDKTAIDFGNPAGTAKKLKEHLPGIAQKYEVKLGETGNYKSCPQSPDQITVEAIGPGATNYKGYRHYISGVRPTDRVNRITIHGQITDGIGQTVLNNQQFNDGGGVFVYFPLTGTTPELNKPLLICLSKNGQKSSNTEDNKWYQRTGTSHPYTWSIDSTFNATHDPNRINTLETNLGGIKSGLTGDTGYTLSGSNIDIDASVTPDQEGETNGALYGSGANQIKVEKKVGDGKDNNPVPNNYVRYSHMPVGGSTFDLNSVKHNGHVLNGITGTGVTAVYVYYKGGQDDNEHGFPLIVCVKRGQNRQTYYKRGNMWAHENKLNKVDPDGLDPDNEEANKGIHNLFSIYLTLKLHSRSNPTHP